MFLEQLSVKTHFFKHDLYSVRLVEMPGLWWTSSDL